MAIQRNEVAEPRHNEWDFAVASKHGVFSRECWNKTVEWDVLLEHAKKIEKICHLLFENTFPSSLFLAIIDLLEANIYVFGDLFYWLTGMKVNTLDPRLYNEALSRIFFWNMRCYRELRQIQHELEQIGIIINECIKHDSVWVELRESSLWISEDWYSHAGQRIKATILWTEEQRIAGHPAFTYVHNIYKYKVSEADKTELLVRISNILRNASYFKDLLGACGCAYYNDFHNLLSSFRKSEKARSRYIQPWERFFNGTRDSLIEKMMSNPDLEPWVNRYIGLERDDNVIGRLFCEEYYDDAFSFPKKEKEEDYYNPDTWLSLLTIAAVLQEYDEQHTQTVKKPAKKSKTSSLFTEFIIDTPKREAVLKRLHEIIDGKQPKTCALTILAAIQKGILIQPTYKALSTEFPEIGERKNYQYYLQRKDNYPDDINSIAKGL